MVMRQHFDGAIISEWKTTHFHMEMNAFPILSYDRRVKYSRRQKKMNQIMFKHLKLQIFPYITQGTCQRKIGSPLYHSDAPNDPDGLFFKTFWKKNVFFQKCIFSIFWKNNNFEISDQKCLTEYNVHYFLVVKICISQKKIIIFEKIVWKNILIMHFRKKKKFDFDVSKSVSFCDRKRFLNVFGVKKKMLKKKCFIALGAFVKDVVIIPPKTQFDIPGKSYKNGIREQKFLDDVFFQHLFLIWWNQSLRTFMRCKQRSLALRYTTYISYRSGRKEKVFINCIIYNLLRFYENLWKNLHFLQFCDFSHPDLAF